MSKEKDSLILYESFFEATQDLSVSDKGEIWEALHAYISDKEDYKFTSITAKLAWNFIKLQLNADAKKWQETCKRRSEAGKRGMQKRWNNSKDITSVNFVINENNKNNKAINVITEKSSVINEITKITDTDTESDTDTDIKEKNILKKEKKFVKPTIAEVKAYVNEHKYRINVDKFYSHYESNGWKVGRNPMKDWKASVRYWASDVSLGNQTDKQTEINYDNGFFNVERCCNG